jgi:hypothetical protein
MLGATVLSSGVVAFGAQRSAPKPAPDPALGDGDVSAFYVWDQEVPSTPGKLLRQEPVPDHLVLTNAEKGLRVLYTATNGIDGKTTVAVSGAIYFPKGPVPAGGWPVVAWAHGTTGVADVCAPSWMPRGKRDTDYLNAWLAQGYAVVASDYQGLGTPGGHPWLSVRPEGWSVLDSVRSALTAFPELANAVVIVGQSQGSHAALSAAGLAKTYAPTLRIRGTVATGVAGGPQWRASRRTSTFLFMVLHKFQALDPAFQPSDYLTDAGKRGFAAAITSCPLPGDPTIPFDDVLKVMPQVRDTRATDVSLLDADKLPSDQPFSTHAIAALLLFEQPFGFSRHISLLQMIDELGRLPSPRLSRAGARGGPRSYGPIPARTEPRRVG